MKHTNTHTQWYFYMHVYLGVFLYKGGYPGCCMGSPTEAAKGEGHCKQVKIPFWSKNRACFINLEIECLSLPLHMHIKDAFTYEPLPIYSFFLMLQSFLWINICYLKALFCSKHFNQLVFFLPLSEGRGPLLRIQRADLSKWREFPCWLQTPVHLHRWSSRLRAPLPQPFAPGFPLLSCPTAGQGARPVLPQHRLPQRNHRRASSTPATPTSGLPALSLHPVPSLPLPKAVSKTLPEVVPLQTQKGQGHHGQRAGGGGAQVGQATWTQAPGG